MHSSHGANPELRQAPERLHERLLHHVVGILARAQQPGSPVRAQRVPGDQHRIGIKVAVPGPGYRVRLVDGTPCSSRYSS
jgi:hypothetical protein